MTVPIAHHPQVKTTFEDIPPSNATALLALLHSKCTNPDGLPADCSSGDNSSVALTLQANPEVRSCRGSQPFRLFVWLIVHPFQPACAVCAARDPCLLHQSCMQRLSLVHPSHPTTPARHTLPGRSPRPPCPSQWPLPSMPVPAPRSASGRPSHKTLLIPPKL